MARNEFSYRSLHGAAKGRRRLLYATVLVLLIFGIDIVSGGVLRDTARSMSSYLWRAVSTVDRRTEASGTLSTRARLARENATLRSENQKLREQAAFSDVLAAENASFRALLALPESAAGITAPIVSSTRSSAYGTFTIGVGQNGGTSVGDLVLTPGGFLVGRIAEVGERTSVVRTIFASGESIDATIPGTAFIAEGRGGGNARASIPRGISVATATPVMSRVYGNRPVGTIGAVESDPAKADQTLYISLPVNLSTLDYVRIIRSI